MKCKTHKDVEAVGQCTTCGDFFCSDCLKSVNGQPYCLEHVQEAMIKYNQPFEDYKSRTSKSYDKRNVEEISIRLNDFEEPSNKKKFRGVKFILVGFVIAVIALSIIGILGKSYEKNKYIGIVKDEHFNDYHNTIGYSFERFFTNCEWEYDSSYDMNVVIFTGDCIYNEEETTAYIYFVVDEYNDSVSVIGVYFDNFYLEDFEIEPYIEDIIINSY